MAKFHVHIVFGGGIQRSEEVHSDKPIEELQKGYLEKIRERQPLVFKKKDGGEASIMVPCDGMLLLLRTDEEQKRIEEQQRQEMLRQRQMMGPPGGVPILGRG